MAAVMARYVKPELSIRTCLGVLRLAGHYDWDRLDHVCRYAIAPVESTEAAAEEGRLLPSAMALRGFLPNAHIAGCNVEFLRIHTAERLGRAITICAVIARRSMLLILSCWVGFAPIRKARLPTAH